MHVYLQSLRHFEDKEKIYFVTETDLIRYTNSEQQKEQKKTKTLLKPLKLINTMEEHKEQKEQIKGIFLKRRNFFSGVFMVKDFSLFKKITKYF